MKEDQTVDLFMDGNAGCALLGKDLMEGEAEFVCIDDAPEGCTHQNDKERWACTQALRRLEARLGRRLGYRTNHPASPFPT